MKIIIELPYPLPLWNEILAMTPYERKRLRDWIHGSILQLQVIENSSMTLMEYQLKQSWMDLLGPVYYQMIRPKKSKALRLKVKKPMMKKRLLK